MNFGRMNYNPWEVGFCTQKGELFLGAEGYVESVEKKVGGPCLEIENVISGHMNYKFNE